MKDKLKEIVSEIHEDVSSNIAECLESYDDLDQSEVAIFALKLNYLRGIIRNNSGGWQGSGSDSMASNMFESIARTIAEEKMNRMIQDKYYNSVK